MYSSARIAIGRLAADLFRGMKMSDITSLKLRQGMQSGHNANMIYAVVPGADLHDEPSICQVFGIPMHISMTNIRIEGREAEGMLIAAKIVNSWNAHATLTQQRDELAEALEKANRYLSKILAAHINGVKDSEVISVLIDRNSTALAKVKP